MNESKAQKQESRSSDAHATLNLQAWHNFPAKADSHSLAGLPRQAVAMSPRLEEMLARVEGIARWGLNE